MSRAEVFERDGSRCRYCGDPAFNIDHVIPRHRWQSIMAVDNNVGLGDNDNCVASCQDCNSYKDNMLLHEAGMSFLPPGTVKSEDEAYDIRESFMKSRAPRMTPAQLRQAIEAGRVSHPPAVYPLSQRQRELLESARQALQNGGLHPGYRHSGV